MSRLNWKNGNLFENVEKLRDQLKQTQIEMEKNPNCSQLKAMKVDYLVKYLDTIADEEKLLFQKSKIEWLQNGDKNSRFFYKVIQSRKNSSRITGICKEEGVRFEGSMIADQFVKHFKDFLGPRDNVEPICDIDSLFVSRLNYQEALSMVEDVTDMEIKNAIFDIGDTKAPGPDGFTSAFFKKAWGIVGNDVCAAVRDFFSNGKLLGEVNATIISLVPKIQQPNKISEYRPIACCNVLYKCISKILTERIKPALHKLVNDNQMFCVDEGGGEQRILDILLFNVGKLPVKYLGIPLLAKKIGINDCKILVDEKKTYWASVVMVLKATVNEINRSKNGRVKLKGKSFWEINVNQSDSGTWKTLLDLRTKVRQFIIYEIGNGNNTSMWHDYWHEIGPLSSFIDNRCLYDARPEND
ncbi:hypothetical protein Tco_0269366 [Tanacetum coccineum]